MATPVASDRPARDGRRESFNSGLIIVAQTGSESETNPQLAYKNNKQGDGIHSELLAAASCPGFGSLLAMEIDKKEREIDGGCAWWRSRARALPSNAAPCSSSSWLLINLYGWMHGSMDGWFFMCPSSPPSTNCLGMPQLARW